MTSIWLPGLVSLLSTVTVGAILGRGALEARAVSEAGGATVLLARSVVEPVLEDGLLAGARTSIAQLDDVMARAVLSESVLRVRLSTGDGRIVYSDQPLLIGRVLPLRGDERDVLRGAPPRAGLVDADDEDSLLLGSDHRLLEAYERVALPNGTYLLFETYSSFTHPASLGGAAWRASAPTTAGAVGLVALCQLPLAVAFGHRLRKAAHERARLLRYAIDASMDERRRIAGHLHDSIVQGLVGASFVVAANADVAAGRRLPEVASQLRAAYLDMHRSINGLRSLLVGVYPTSVSSAGLPAVLAALASDLRSQGIAVTARIPATLDLTREAETLVFRVAREVLLNAARHSRATNVSVSVKVTSTALTLEISDDGAGLDVAAVRGRRDGHVGIALLCDLAEESGAVLEIASAPWAGTRVRLEVPAR